MKIILYINIAHNLAKGDFTKRRFAIAHTCNLTIK